MSKLSFADAAYQILEKQREPLSTGEITARAISEGLISTSGRTPAATMAARLYMDIKGKGGKSRFVKTDRGKFGLRRWSTSAAKTISPFPHMSFKDAAYQVLKAKNHPLPVEDITDIALKEGLLKTTGKTPDASMGAQIYTDIKTLRDRSAFVQLGKNRFGLTEWGLEVIKDEIEKAEGEKVLTVTERKRSIVGDPIDFGGLIYGPLNEKGVIFLFSKIHDKLGINIEAIQAAFPDAKGRSKTTRGWEDVWIEFELKSSHFKSHGHDPKECDTIVCWEHDWKDCPIKVIELKKEVDRLKGK